MRWFGARWRRAGWAANRRDRSPASTRCVPAGNISVVRGQRIDDLRDLGDRRDRNAAEFGVFLHGILVLGQVDAERLVPCQIAVLPLNVWAECFQGLVRG